MILLWMVLASPARALEAFPAGAGWNVISSVEVASEIIGPGVTYERWSLVTAQGPLAVSLLTVDTGNPFVSLGAVAANGSVQGPGEQLSALADAAHAEAGINSDYFDINGSGAPLNALVAGGRFLHGPDGAATLSIDTSGHIAIGPLMWTAHVQSANAADLTVSTINDWSASTPLTLLTPDLGATAAYGATEVVLTPVFGETYSVREIATDLTTLVALQAGEVAVAAHSQYATALTTKFATGQSATVTFDGSPAPASIVTAVGGGPQLLRAGAAYADPNTPAPRESDVRYPLTGAGVTADRKTLWLVVVDGRSPGASVGITRPMLTSFFSALGASDAMAFDSGGSSEMVVRSLGSASVRVATTPSDGRERSIADALVVTNTATPGPAAQLLLSAATPSVLTGSRDQLTIAAVDTNMQSAPPGVGCDGLTISPANSASIDAACRFVALTPGDISVTVASGAARGTLLLTAVASITSLTIAGYAPAVATGATAQLFVSATDANGHATSVDPGVVLWTVEGGARIDALGRLSAGDRPSTVRVGAKAGGVQTYSDVAVGDHETAIAGDLRAFNFVSSGRLVSGGLSQAPAPDGSNASQLSYDIAPGSGVRAAYAVGSLAVAGAPLALSFDVHGDDNGEWLRASYVEPGGIVDTLTIARHVDWSGWKHVRVALPPQAHTSIDFTRIYVAQTTPDPIRGALWLRNISAVYPGP